MIKQVIIIRKDLKMRRGKEISQGAHASVKCIRKYNTDYSLFLLSLINLTLSLFLLMFAFLVQYELILIISIIWTFIGFIFTKHSINVSRNVYKKWEKNGQTKITLRVDSEKELIDIYNSARKMNLNAQLITDSGKTEFNKPTRTAVAIGPDYSEKIDKITKKLKLY